MKLDKICRACLSEKSFLKPLFGACIPNMLMTCASIQVLEGDGFPNQICTQCLQMVNRAYSFKQQCEKSDNILRSYVNSLNIQLGNEQNLITEVKNDNLFSTNDVLQQSSLFSDIFNDENAHTFVHNFGPQNNVVSDLAETMQSLQTIAEQCLPASWENDVNIVNVHNISEETCDGFNYEQLFKCQFCEDMFKDEWSLAEHIKIHVGQGKYFCEICGKSCGTLSTLNKHIQLHCDERKTIEKRNNQQKPNICTICGKEFVQLKILKKHLREFHSDNKELAKKYACTICDKRYGQNKLLSIHMRSHTGERPLSCEICGKTFSLPSSLHKHRLIHNANKKYKCTFCDKTFNQGSNLNIHIRSHTGEKPFVCTICGRRCATNVNLEIHMRTHTGEKPYKCTTCNSSFATCSQLKKHNLRHTGERPYKCVHCDKSFRQKDTRDTHVRYHTGERPYVCKLCPKKYIAASHLRVHMKTHLNETKYECTECKKKFYDMRSFKIHNNSHSADKPPHMCKLCGKALSQHNELHIHLEKVHNSVST